MRIRETTVPPEFFTRISETFGVDGLRWLSSLPAVADFCESHWELVLGPMFPDPTYQLLFPATRADGSAVVLKLGVPRVELRGEATFLSHFTGRGVVQLIDTLPEVGALLIKRIVSGRQLASVASHDDDAATRIWCSAFRTLHEPRPTGPYPDFPSLATWLGAFERYEAIFGDHGPLPAATFNLARTLAAELLTSTTETALLHGDLHHHNIICNTDAQGDWVVIDPQGVIGDLAYEPAPFFRNPGSVLIGGTDPTDVMKRRLRIIHEETSLAIDRVRDWAYVGSVLSALWMIEDAQNRTNASLWSFPLQCASWIQET